MDPHQVGRLTEYFRGYVSNHKQEVLEKALLNRTRYLTVMLEDIFQPQNASAVLRTCDCFGVQDVHIIENINKFKINQNVVMGATKWLDVHQYSDNGNNTLDAIIHLKEKGYKVVTAHPDPIGISIYDLNLTEPLALLFGTEKTGLSNDALANSNQSFFIPMYGLTESYNISVSVAITLTILRQRLTAEKISFSLSEMEKNLLRLQWYKKMVRHADILEKEFLKGN